MNSQRDQNNAGNQEDLNFRRILAIDSACEYLQVGLTDGDGQEYRVLNLGLKHAERLVPAVQSILADMGLKPADLDALVVSRGPGSFTGLRIGMSAAKGLMAALDIPLVSVSSLEAIARSHAGLAGMILPALDARKQRFYAGLYSGSAVPEEISPAADLSPEGILGMIDSAQAASNAGTGAGGPVYICGPHAQLLYSRIIAVSDAEGSGALEKKRPGSGVAGSTATAFHPLPFIPWISALLELGRQALERGERDSEEQSPDYIRVSEAELGITLKAK